MKMENRSKGSYASTQTMDVLAMRNSWGGPQSYTPKATTPGDANTIPLFTSHCCPVAPFSDLLVRRPYLNVRRHKVWRNFWVPVGCRQSEQFKRILNGSNFKKKQRRESGEVRGERGNMLGLFGSPTSTVAWYPLSTQKLLQSLDPHRATALSSQIKYSRVLNYFY